MEADSGAYNEMEGDDAMNTPLSRRDRRKIETRERLFEAAMSLFAERDFDVVTVEMITESADVGKGTFFNYFKNKEAVIAYYFEKIKEELLQGLQPVIADLAEARADAPPIEPSTVWSQVVRTMRMVAAHDSRNRKMTRTLLALGLTNDAVRAASLKIKQDVFETGVALVRHGQRNGELRADYPPEAIAEFIRNVYFSTLYTWAQSEDETSLETRLETNLSIARAAVCPRRS